MRWLHRRWWCVRLGHPRADWSPIVMNDQTSDDREILIRQYRCTRHDKEERA